MIRTAANDHISIDKAGHQVCMTITAKGQPNRTVKLWPDEAARISKELAITAQKRNNRETEGVGRGFDFPEKIQ